MFNEKLDQLVAAFKTLEERYTKDGRSYLKLAGVIQGSRPNDCTAEQNGLVYSSGTYQLCAKGIRDILKEHDLWDVSIKDEQNNCQENPSNLPTC